jgi:hypothetical protein
MHFTNSDINVDTGGSVLPGRKKSKTKSFKIWVAIASNMNVGTDRVIP